MSNHTKTKGRIPTFSSTEEEAAFWDTHDTSEFEGEFEPVELEISDPLLHSISMRFDGPTFKRLVAVAKQHGIGPVALAQRWVEQAIMRADAERPEPSQAKPEIRNGDTSSDQARSADGCDR